MITKEMRNNRTMSTISSIFSFPNPVNEVAARIVAGMVVLLTLATIISGQTWLMLILVYGFLARVAAGPTLSPMALIATKVLAPRLAKPQPVPGPPKRFAQTIGLAFSGTALALHFIGGWTLAANSLLGVLALFATLESVAGFCAGCFVFNQLMRIGMIPESVCKECAILSQPSTD